jgi:hypothetical protein
MRDQKIAILAPRSRGIVSAGSRDLLWVRCRQKSVKISLLPVRVRLLFVG